MRYLILTATLVFLGCGDDGSEKLILEQDGGELAADAAPPGPDADPLAPDAGAAGPDAAGLPSPFCEGAWDLRVYTTQIGNCFDIGDIRIFQIPVLVTGATVAAQGFEVQDGVTFASTPTACAWTAVLSGQSFTFEIHPADAGEGAISGTAWVHGAADCMQRANIDGHHE
jgi:hypothetical protein